MTLKPADVTSSASAQQQIIIINVTLPSVETPRHDKPAPAPLISHPMAPHGTSATLKQGQINAGSPIRPTSPGQAAKPKRSGTPWLPSEIQQLRKELQDTDFNWHHVSQCHQRSVWALKCRALLLASQDHPEPVRDDKPPWLASYHLTWDEYMRIRKMQESKTGEKRKRLEVEDVLEVAGRVHRLVKSKRDVDQMLSGLQLDKSQEPSDLRTMLLDMEAILSGAAGR